MDIKQIHQKQLGNSATIDNYKPARTRHIALHQIFQGTTAITRRFVGIWFFIISLFIIRTSHSCSELFPRACIILASIQKASDNAIFVNILHTSTIHIITRTEAAKSTKNFKKTMRKSKPFLHITRPYTVQTIDSSISSFCSEVYDAAMFNRLQMFRRLTPFNVFLLFVISFQNVFDFFFGSFFCFVLFFLCFTLFRLL